MLYGRIHYIGKGGLIVIVVIIPEGKRSPKAFYSIAVIKQLNSDCCNLVQIFAKEDNIEWLCKDGDLKIQPPLHNSVGEGYG